MNETGRRRRRLLAVSGPVAAAVLAGAAIVAVESAAGQAAPASGGRTATARTRELAATVTAGGVVESAAEAAVLAGRTATVPVGGGTNTGASGTSGSGAAAHPVSMAATAQKPAETLTAMAAVGATVRNGTVVYALDGEPVVAVVGGTPSWRTLKTGADDGPDVRTLEKTLRALGYGDDLTVDDHFGSATAAAVERWEEDLGRADPDGVVEPGEILLVTAPSQVVEHDVALGDAVAGDTQVLALESDARVVTATVAAEDVAAWKPGAAVTIRWSGGGTAAGKVTAVGRDADLKTGTVDVTVVPTTGGIDRHAGTAADVDLVTGTRAGAVAVPVAALHGAALHGGPAVTVLAADGTAAERPVTIGLVADGWAEVTAGLTAGQRVRLP